jgi:hypothetical protein
MYANADRNRDSNLYANADINAYAHRDSDAYTDAVGCCSRVWPGRSTITHGE